jgi:hypothetical protein
MKDQRLLENILVRIRSNETFMKNTFKRLLDEHLFNHGIGFAHAMRNRFSRYDWFAGSGQTDIIIEEKNKEASIKDYPDGYIEVQKFDSLSIASKMNGAPAPVCGDARRYTV